ncbi:MAG: hypothetical protein ABIK89_25060 [Planctomycetota bacterium]
MRAHNVRFRLGLLALAFWGVHAAAHLVRGTPEQLLWVCHVAALGVGLGLLFGRRWLNAMGVLVLLVGTPAWAANLFIAGTFLPTSLLPHVGGLVLGLVGLNLLGPPESDWWKALALVALLLLISRAVVSVAGNVNLVYGIWPKMADWWPLRGPTIPAQLAAWAVVLWSVERCLRRRQV